jgi:hypothetical protein
MFTSEEPVVISAVLTVAFDRIVYKVKTLSTAHWPLTIQTRRPIALRA